MKHQNDISSGIIPDWYFCTLKKICNEIVKKYRGFNLILFNDDHHSMQTVSAQLVKALKCSQSEAWNKMLMVHRNGSAIVLTGTREICELADKILSEIDLATRIEEAE
jgi:ATP-dependent Clp protease adapter protein ClpS